MQLERLPDGLWAGRFEAMASPCELLIDGGDAVEATEAEGLLARARSEVLRIERKYSRYRADSELARWHLHAGKPLHVDDESVRLLNLAALCHVLSSGLFDITSGVLREVWRFDGSDHVPDAEAVARVASRVGWSRVGWEGQVLTLPPGMELDFGGLGKEYAADRVLGLLRERTERPLLVNLGGDLVTSGLRANGEPWHVGIEGAIGHAPAAGLIALRGGALATSGDSRRYLLKDGVRYSHILDPRSGWPVQDAPRSVTVAAPTCTEAGLMATLAMLNGSGAEALLAAQGLPYWVQREA